MYGHPGFSPAGELVVHYRGGDIGRRCGAGLSRWKLKL